VKSLMLLLWMCALTAVVCGQERQCPHFSSAEARRLEKEARWLVSPSLQRQIAKRSYAFGFLIEFARCHVLESRLLSDEDEVAETLYFVSDGIALQAMIGRYRGVWTMAVVPYDAVSKMPDINLLEMTEHKWTLSHRDKDKGRKILATGHY
jgi:hypothetical protein